MIVTNEEALWWDEDARRLQEMCERVEATGAVVDTEEGESPALNEDGSLATEDGDGADQEV